MLGAHGLKVFRATVRLSVLLVVLVCGLPGVVTGQERSGFWVGFDVGAGSTGTSASGTVGSVFGDYRNWCGASAGTPLSAIGSTTEATSLSAFSSIRE